MNLKQIIKITSKIVVVSFFLSFTSNTITKNLQQEIKYKNYLNQQFGFSVDYPYEILIPQGESQNKDGQIFRSKKTPDNSLTVYRDYLDLTDTDTKFTLEVGYNKHVKTFSKKEAVRNVTYKKLDKNFFVLSGYKSNGDIYYQKSIMIDDVLCTCLLEYKVTDKVLFNKISERVFKSFK